MFFSDHNLYVVHAGKTYWWSSGFPLYIYTPFLCPSKSSMKINI